MPKRPAKNSVQSVATDEDYQRFAEQFADDALDPRKPWVAQCIMVFGFPLPVPTEEHIASGALIKKIHTARTSTDAFMDEWIYEGLTHPDRNLLVHEFRERVKQQRLTKDELIRLLAYGNLNSLKRSLASLRESFKFRPGPAPPTQHQYEEALRQSDVLVPALLTLDRQLSIGTSHSLKQNLKYLSKDFPEACQFLLENSDVLRESLDDPKVMARGKTRPNARARALADAIAGSVYLNRKSSTAIESLRKERKKRQVPSR